MGRSLTGTLSHQNDADDVGSHRSYRPPMASNGLLTSHSGIQVAALGYSQIALTNLQWPRMAEWPAGFTSWHKRWQSKSSATTSRAHTVAWSRPQDGHPRRPQDGHPQDGLKTAIASRPLHSQTCAREHRRLLCNRAWSLDLQSGAHKYRRCSRNRYGF